jgi:hypothetical protein
LGRQKQRPTVPRSRRSGIRGPDNHRAEFAVTADGQRSLVLRILEMESRFAHIEIIQNLTELLRRRAAAR